jgi:hypothetical protein
MPKLRAPHKPLIACASAALCVALGACGQTVSTGSFSGEQHEVATVVSNLQSHVSAGEESKICSDDLAGEVVARLNTAPGGCKSVIKEQLGEVDSASLTVSSIQLGGTSAKRSALATVRSTYSGKTRTSTLALVKQGGKWKIAAVP